LKGAWYDRSLVTADVVEGYRRPLLQPGVAEGMWRMTRLAEDRSWVAAGAARLHLPCLVITGRNDRWATDVTVPGAQRVVLERCGHLPQEEHPDRVASEIQAFLGGLQTEMR